MDQLDDEGVKTVWLCHQCCVTMVRQGKKVWAMMTEGMKKEVAG
jgi:hypothetical protein